jgi:hypothetical protein
VTPGLYRAAWGIETPHRMSDRNITDSPVFAGIIARE